jgi:citronellol/citronellal dehydrogenase
VAIGQFDARRSTKYPKAIVDNVAQTVPAALGTEDEMAWLTAFLASPAGDFFSGCVLTVGAPRQLVRQVAAGGAAGEEGEPLSRRRKSSPLLPARSTCR